MYAYKYDVCDELYILTSREEVAQKGDPFLRQTASGELT
jgi:hypothetical protein